MRVPRNWRKVFQTLFNWKVRVYRYNFPVIPLVIVGTIFLNLIGFTDFFFERNFNSGFRWANVDVRRKVVDELTGHNLSSEGYINDLSTFKLHSSQFKCDYNKTSLLIIIKSAPDRIDRRNAYRRTLLKVKTYQKWRVRTIFVLGLEGNKVNRVVSEAKAFGDIVVGDFLDHYFNNTYKLVYSIKTAREYCDETPYLISLDDDYMISIPNIINYLSKHTKNEQLYAGWRIDSSPFRLRFQRFSVSLKEYPYSLYPPYITGGMVIFTPQAVKEFYAAIKYLRFFKFDDVYAGIIAYFLGYSPQMLATTPVSREYNDFGDKLGEHGYSVKEIEEMMMFVNKDVQK
ncbi:unnamed protein product [Bursaphelenchus xylophilus]|uniref:Hexosyltransferase n=1 Tax=Bursaphelenchus xylophilus TaxID=6326 RepID=A0A1I7SLR8_BURXY|nr:unnamed protein product [Bursaphelenchus xylophilus]CAG9129714.1 unnamed protein product [Bursaphelenchus xylophilus]